MMAAQIFPKTNKATAEGKAFVYNKDVYVWIPRKADGRWFPIVFAPERFKPMDVAAVEMARMAPDCFHCRHTGK